MAASKAKNKRIAFFTPNFNGGGAERVMITYANEISKLGYDVCYIVVNGYGPLQGELNEEIHLINLQKKRIMTATLALYRTLTRKKIDILVSTLTHANIIAIIAARMTLGRSKIIIREASTPSKARAFNKNRFQNLMASIIFPFAHRVIAVSQGVKEDFIATYKVDPSKVTVVYNPVDNPQKASVPTEYLQLPKEVKIIVAIGRVTAVKNYSLLLRAIALIDSDIKCHTYILGQTDLVPLEFEKVSNVMKENNLQSQVSFLGFRKDYYRFLQHSDVYVLSSEYEGLPNALMQSLSYGVPAISTDASSGVREILDNGRFGTIVPTGDANTLAQAISKQLRENTFKESELKSRAEYFSVSKCIDGVENAIQK